MPLRSCTSWSSVALWFGVLVGTTACDSAPPVSAEQKRARWLRLDLAAGRIELRNADQTILAFGGASAIGFRTASAKVTHNFGSFLFAEDPPPPWASIASLRQATAADLPDAITLEGMDAAGAQLAKVELFHAAGNFRLRVTPTGTWNRSTLAYPCQPGEHFVGLGGQSFDVDHRGQRAALWVEEDGIGKVPTEEPPAAWFLNGKRHQTHTPMPIYQSSRGYAVVLRSDHRVVADVCKSDPAQVRWENWHGTLDLTVLVDADPLALRRKLGLELGVPAVLPGFALMPWINAIYGSANVRRIASKLREGGFPISVVWSEDWRGGTATDDIYTLDEDWLADSKLYPDLPKLASDLHALGYKFLTYNNTFITKGADVFDEAVAQHYAIHRDDGTVYTFTGAKFEPATLLDLWNPTARAWATAKYATGLQAGADGWMADFAEWLPTDARLADGSRGLDRHQQYPVEFQKLTRDLFAAFAAKDGVERLFFVRSAWLGSQPLLSVVWAGDQQTDFSAGDGLPSVIPMGLGLGMTGFPYFGSDIAGYASFGTEPTSKELYFRWVTLGALSPIMRTHHGKSAQANWNWERDGDTEAHFRHWTRIHAQLWPYLWLLASDPQLPLMRPAALHYPQFDKGWTATDQYLLGDRVLVAPVVESGKTSRTVAFPPGKWWPLFGGDAVQGPAELPVAVSLTQVAAFAAQGSLLPLLPPDDVRAFSEQLTKAPAAQAIAALAPALHVRVWPGQALGGAGRYDGPFGQLHWQGQAWTGTCKSATWNGKPVAIDQGAVAVPGPGKLVLDGTGTLSVTKVAPAKGGSPLVVHCLGNGWKS